MIGALLGSWRLVGLGALAAGLVGYHLYSVHTARTDGRAAALSEVRALNDKTAKDARDAVQDLMRDCARDPDKCLLDAWTRDR